MARLNISTKRFPAIRDFSPGERLHLTFTGSVDDYKEVDGEMVLRFSVAEIGVEKNRSRQHPGEVMKQMVELQGMQSISRP